MTLRPNAYAGPSEDFADGKTLGNTTKSTVGANLRNGQALDQLKAAVPSYSPNPPQAGFAGNVDLSGPAAAAQATCAVNPADPVCAAYGIASKPRPVNSVPLTDPALAGLGVVRDPSLVLGNIGNTYTACTTSTPSVTATTPATTQTCQVATGPWSVNVCEKTLEVVPKDKYTCAVGNPAAQANFIAGLPFKWLGHVEAMCDVNRSDGKLQFRWGTCIDCPGFPAPMQSVDVDVSRPQPPAGQLPNPLGTIINKYGTPVTLYVDGPGCNGADCELRVWMITGPGFDWDRTCPPGQILGDQVWLPDYTTDPATMQRGSRNTCYTNDLSGNPVVAGQSIAGTTYSPTPDSFYRVATLKFKKPAFEKLAGDYWTDGCKPFVDRTPPALLPPDGTNVSLTELPGLSLLTPDFCLRSQSQCLEGPATRLIDGVSVTRECWRWRNTFDCSGALPSTTCSQSAHGNCSQSGPRQCNTYDAAGHCTSATYMYTCPGTTTYTPPVNCPTTSFCTGGSCWDQSHPPDKDFGTSVALLEAGREAAKTLDTANMTVFNGYNNSCRSMVNYGVSNCCKSGNSGAAMMNNYQIAQTALGAASTTYQAVFSTYTYDALFVSDAPAAVLSGFEALAGTGYSSTLAGVLAGDIGVGEFMSSLVPGPWTIALLVIALVMYLSSCDEAEMVTAMKKEARLCHYIGEKVTNDAFGAARNKTQVQCCFTSRLSRIINEQGRPQLGRGWGTADAPQCRGFTIPELQSLDFAKMDLSEFIAEIIPKSVTGDPTPGSNVGKPIQCYYGQGKC